jgi:hypothetical protein
VRTIAGPDEYRGPCDHPTIGQRVVALDKATRLLAADGVR